MEFQYDTEHALSTLPLVLKKKKEKKKTTKIRLGLSLGVIFNFEPECLLDLLTVANNHCS
jgi:hypothetical protein